MSKEIGPRRLHFTLTEEEAFQLPPPRRTLCPNYDSCLDYASDRLWISFTCRGCLIEERILSGEVKELSPPKVRSSLVFDSPVYTPPTPWA